MRHRFPALPLAFIVSVAALGCSGAEDPEIVAIEYLRAVHSGNADEAVRHIDIEGLVERVEDQVVVVQREGGSETLMRDSIETILWGLFQQSPQEEFSYDARTAEIDGDRATVTVEMTDSDGETTERTLQLRRGSSGWKVGGDSLDPMVNYVVQRLQERF